MGKKKKNKHQRTDSNPGHIDEEVQEQIDKISETDNSSESRSEKFNEEILRTFLRNNVIDIYPRIGVETYRVPHVHINKEGSRSGRNKPFDDDNVKEIIPPQDTDSRSDRAHSFICDALQELSYHSVGTGLPPFFILSSYEYDHYLSRLKDKQNSTEMKDVKFPKGSGVERGEADIILLVPKHVIFIEVKAVGDNFDQYQASDDVIRVTIKKAAIQLDRDEKVFNYVFQDLDLKHIHITKIIAVPNLTRDAIHNALETDQQLKETCAAYKLLCKEDFPVDRFNYNSEFHHFTTWWRKNVFYERPKGAGNQISQNDEKILDDLKVIVGRYVGLLSLVTVSSISNFGSRRKEFRRKGQAAWYVGEKFSEISLTHTQMGYIAQNCRLGYLCGPPGSGKTVVLVTKARRWILSTGNYVVVVNMYRGSRGRAIGKKIYKSIVSNNQPEKHQVLKDHCYEYAVNVDKFNRPKFVASIKRRWPDIGTDGEKILFLVDETYVENYWSEVFTALREDFKESSLWCAGLYGAQPQNFYSMKLKEVIRCPPQIQRVLSLIEWNDERKECYVTDSTTASLPTDGPMVMTVRHSEHEGFSHLHPSQCLICGQHLLHLLQDQLNVEKPDDKHKAPDLRECTLKCSDVLFLVNMPRTAYIKDKGGFLDTTKDKFEAYMQNLWDCPMLKVLHDAGYPSDIHCNLKCSNLFGETTKEVINVAWIYTCQGLENTVVVFLPGDEGVTDVSKMESDLLDPLKNIPCPGLQGKQLLLDSGSECSSSSEGTDGEGTSEKNLVGRDVLSSGSSQLPSNKVLEEKTFSQGQLSIEMFNFRDSDVARYSRWDKNNLFISASRCTAQLILITS